MLRADPGQDETGSGNGGEVFVVHAKIDPPRPLPVEDRQSVRTVDRDDPAARKAGDADGFGLEDRLFGRPAAEKRQALVPPAK